MLAKIFDSVKQEEYREDKKFVNLIPLNFPKKRVDVKISLEFKETIKDIVKEIRETINEDFKTELKGIRLFKQLIALAKASALRDGRIKVISKDVDRLRYLSHWMNLKQRNLKDNYPFSGDDVA
jgi:MoxR-like ATPase